MSKIIQKWMNCDIINCNKKVYVKYKINRNNLDELIRINFNEWGVSLCITHDIEFKIKIEETFLYMKKKITN